MSMRQVIASLGALALFLASPGVGQAQHRSGGGRSHSSHAVSHAHSSGHAGRGSIHTTRGVGGIHTTRGVSGIHTARGARVGVGRVGRGNYSGFGRTGYGGRGDFYGRGYGRGYYDGGFYGGLGWPYYGYGAGPYYYPDDYYYGPGYLDTGIPFTSTPVPVPSASDNTAFIDVRVPPNAVVWFNGASTDQTGSDRTFVSPPLAPGQLFAYEVRARWVTPSGRVVDRTRQIQIQAGQQYVVDFFNR